MQLLLLTVAACAGVYARTAVGPLQETIRLALGLSDNQMALLQGPALAVPMLIAAIPLGLAIDRYSRVRLLRLFAALSILASLSTALTSHFAVLLTVRCLVGLTAAATSLAAYSVLADHYMPAQRGRANMVMAVGEVGGAAVAFALGGLFVSLFGSVNGWRWALLCMTTPLLLALASMSALREPARTGLGIEKPSLRVAGAELWRYRTVFIPLLAGRILVGIADGAALIWAAPLLSRRFALSADRVGAIMAAVLLVSGVLGPIAGGLLADRCQRAGGPRRTLSILLVLALLSVPAALFAIVPGVLAASVLLTAFIGICSANIVIGVTLTTVVIPNELRGLSMATQMAAGVLFGIGLAPMLVSLLSNAIGGPARLGTALVLVCIATSFAGAAIFAWGRRYFPRAAV